MRTIQKALLDTNLLLLWLVSRVDPLLVLQFKRVRTFSIEDIEVLHGLLLPFRILITTPHILAETSNFVDQAPPQWRAALVQEFRQFVEEHAELFIPAEAMVKRAEFNSLGLTDTALVSLSLETLVLTIDFELAGRIEAIGGNVLNFQQYRT